MRQLGHPCPVGDKAFDSRKKMWIHFFDTHTSLILKGLSAAKERKEKARQQRIAKRVKAPVKAS